MELTVQNMALFIMSFLHVIFVFFYKMKKIQISNILGKLFENQFVSELSFYSYLSSHVLGKSYKARDKYAQNGVLGLSHKSVFSELLEKYPTRVHEENRALAAFVQSAQRTHLFRNVFSVTQQNRREPLGTIAASALLSLENFWSNPVESLRSNSALPKFGLRHSRFSQQVQTYILSLFAELSHVL